MIHKGNSSYFSYGLDSVVINFERQILVNIVSC